MPRCLISQICNNLLRLRWMLLNMPHALFLSKQEIQQHTSQRLCPQPVLTRIVVTRSLCIVQVLKQWVHYILGKEIILHTDHQPLQFFNSHFKNSIYRRSAEDSFIEDSDKKNLNPFYSNFRSVIFYTFYTNYTNIELLTIFQYSVHFIQNSFATLRGQKKQSIYIPQLV